MSAAKVSRGDGKSTRERILVLLRKSSQTVNDLAAALELTDNAIRAHLKGLEDDGLVRTGPLQKGYRKPHQSFELTEKARDAFAKAHEPILNALLGVLEQRMPRRQREGFLRDVGVQLARPNLPEGSSSHQVKLEHACNLLKQLGGLPSVEDDGTTIRGSSCPLGTIVSNHPEACLVAEALLAELIGVQVQSRCSHSPVPACCFHIADVGGAE